MSNVARNDPVNITMASAQFIKRELTDLRQQVRSLARNKRGRGAASATELVPVFNDSGINAPQGAVMFFASRGSNFATFYDLEQSSQDRESPPWILPVAIDDQEKGRAFLAARNRIYKVRADDFASTVVGDRLSVKGSDFDLQIDDVGPFIVVDKGAAPTSPFVLAQYAPVHIPILYKALTDETGGSPSTITARRVDSTGATPGTHPVVTFIVLP